MTACPRCDLPFTTDDLRWYFDGRAEAAMGVRSSHEGFEAMLIAGPPTGYQSGHGAERRIARAIDSGATERHRCIRTHRLGDLAPHHLEVLRVAYDGQDWTRLLDQHVGRGPRVELQRRFPHEQLQVALLTPTVQRTLAKPEKPTGEGTPVYASEESALTSLRRILGCGPTSRVDHVQKKLARLASWARGKPVRFDAAPLMEQLRILVDHPTVDTPDEKLAVVRAARRLLASSERVAHANVRIVAKGKIDRAPPSTPQALLVSLLTKRGRKTLAKIREESEKMLLAARRAAGVTDPYQPSTRRRLFSAPKPTASIQTILAASPLHG